MEQTGSQQGINQADRTGSITGLFYSLKSIPRLIQYHTQGSLKDAFLGLFLSTFFINLLGLVFPLALLQTYDRVVPNSSKHTLYLLVGAIILALVFESILRIARATASSWADTRFDYLMGNQLFSKIMQSQIRAYEKLGTGTHLEQLTSLNSIKDFYTGQAIIALLDMPFIALYLGLIAYIAGPLVFIPIIMLTIFVITAKQHGDKLHEQLSTRHDIDNQRLNFIIETLNAIHTVKALAMEAPMLRRYERLLDRISVTNQSLTVKNAAAVSFTGLIAQTTMASVAAVGSILVLHGQLTIGGLAASTLLAGRCLQPINRAIMGWTKLQKVRLSEEYMKEVTELPSEISTHKKDIGTIKGNIRIEDLCFGYERDHLLLNHANLDIAQGETVSIHGDSLNGKSTLLWLIMGLLQPQTGKILLDDCPIDKYNIFDVREQIAYVPQDGVLFNGTIMDNLTLFDDDLMEEAKHASMIMGLDRVIHHLPKGYNTPVGNRAVETLPRGIKQCIAITRCFVKKPKILLFDEANAAVDHIIDRNIRAFIKHLKGRVTMVLISHRPSLLKLSDKTYRLEQGVLVRE